MDSSATPTPDLAQLYRELHPRLVAAARSWAPPEQVDDVVQDTWTAVISGIDRFEGRSTISTWVFGILWRQSARRWRSRPIKLVPLEVARADEEWPSSNELADESWRSDPVRRTESRLEGQVALNVIADLPVRYRTILTMRDVCDWTATEAQAALGLSTTNQRVLLHRARRRARRELAELGVAV